MSSPVKYTLTGNIGVISVDSPPVNALSHAVRQGSWTLSPRRKTMPARLC